MLLNEKTLETYGYSFESISEKSSKLLIVTCDYCGIEYTVSKKNRHINHLVIAKDACSKCKYIKMKEMNAIKYGVENVFQLKEVKSKSRSTNLEKYGCEHPSQNEEVKTKVKETNLEKYGATTYLGSDEGQDNMKRVCLDKYGVENASSADEVKEKRKETCLEKFGRETYLGSEDHKEKTIQTLGVDNVFKLPEMQQQIRETRLSDGSINSYQGKTISEWAEVNGFSDRYFYDLVKTKGWEEAVKIKRIGTKCEEKIRQYLDDNDIEYIFTKKLGKHIPDFQISNLIVECDSLFYHSDYFNKNENYHVEKFEAYRNAGYESLFFTEEEVKNKFEIVSAMINRKLGKVQQIQGYDLVVASGSQESFLLENHILGPGEGETLSLLSDGVAYFVVQFCNGEITRIAEKNGYEVVGGLKRILPALPRPLEVSIDLRYGHGDLTDLGFTYGGTHKSFKWTNGTDSFHRMKFPSNSGYEKGLFKIWDCGQAKWELS